MGDFQITPENAAILSHVRAGGSARIMAGAGTGKTSLLTQIAAEIAEPSLYIAYGNAAAKDARGRFPRHVEVRTFHSLAYEAVGRLAQDRLTSSAWQIRRASLAGFERELQAVSFNRLTAGNVVMETLNNYITSADFDISAKHVPKDATRQHGVDVDAAIRLARKVRHRWFDRTSDCPISHDVYGKIWQMSQPQLPHRILYFDEAQDAGGVMLAVSEAQQNARTKIYVGDPNQSIFAFRNAVNALESLTGYPRFDLTQSWRFGPEIARFANAILQLKGSDLRLLGAPHIESVIRQVSDPDVIITRTNVGAFKAALQCVSQNPIAKIEMIGGFSSVEKTVVDVVALYEGKAVSPQGELRFFSSWHDFKGAAEEPGGERFKPFLKLLEQYGPADLKKEIEGLRSHIVIRRDDATVRISTAHAFKGQEADIVQHGDDFWPFAQFDPETRRIVLDVQEANLAYVAATRGRTVVDVSNYLPVLRETMEKVQIMRRTQDRTNGGRSVTSNVGSVR
jgi:superfamily I DNA/RNA helicase